MTEPRTTLVLDSTIRIVNGYTPLRGINRAFCLSLVMVMGTVAVSCPFKFRVTFDNRRLMESVTADCTSSFAIDRNESAKEI